jgi:hypothetical protein
VQDELDLIGELVSLKIHKGNENTILDDVTDFCTRVISVAKKMDPSPTPDAQENWITQLNASLSKQAASTGLFMKNPNMDKKLTLAQWCKVLVQRSCVALHNLKFTPPPWFTP